MGDLMSGDAETVRAALSDDTGRLTPAAYAALVTDALAALSRLVERVSFLEGELDVESLKHERTRADRDALADLGRLGGEGGQTCADSHDHKGYSQEKCLRCGWVMGQPALNCQNDDTPHRFPSQMPLAPSSRGGAAEHKDST